MTKPLRFGCAALALALICTAMACATAEVCPCPAPAPAAAAPVVSPADAGPEKRPLSVYVSAFKDRTSSLTADAVAGTSTPATVNAETPPSSDGAELEKTVPEEIGAIFSLSSQFVPTPDPSHCDLLLVGIIQDALNGHLKLAVRFVSCATKAVVATTQAELPYEWRRGLQRPVSKKLKAALDELAAQLPAK